VSKRFESPVYASDRRGKKGGSQPAFCGSWLHLAVQHQPINQLIIMLTSTTTTTCIDLVSRTLCWIDPFVSICYIIFAGIAIAVGLLQNSFLVDLVSHGKTRAVAADTSAVTKKQKRQSKQKTVSLLQTWLLYSKVCLVPKKIGFLHFYIVGLISLAASTAVYYFHNHNNKPDDDKTTTAESVLIAILFLHLSRRCQECLSVHNWNSTSRNSSSSSSRVHVSVYIVGLIHYILLPLVFIPPTAWCGGHNGRRETTRHPDGVEQPPGKACWMLAAFLCLWAQYQQRRHHIILANLRSSDKKKDDQQQSTYHLPVGGWFQFVSCPHYLAEILIYLTLIAMAFLGGGGSSNSSRSDRRRYMYLLAWVVANLTVSARHNQTWYRQNIPHFDQLHRKAIFPFLL
jgi:3-oxo-5-alpha-steroid 4-dehydrogenase 3 / polyprenol reductase